MGWSGGYEDREEWNESVEAHMSTFRKAIG